MRKTSTTDYVARPRDLWGRKAPNKPLTLQERIKAIQNSGTLPDDLTLPVAKEQPKPTHSQLVDGKRKWSDRIQAILDGVRYGRDEKGRPLLSRHVKIPSLYLRQ